MSEEWRRLRDIPGDYQISTYGRVRNNTRGNLLTSHLAGRTTTVHIKGKGYSLARLMLTTFRSRRHADKYFASYRDGDPTNNRLENLEWRYKGFFFTWINEQDINDIRARWQATSESYAAIGKDYQLGANSIGAIIRGDYWGEVP